MPCATPVASMGTPSSSCSSPIGASRTAEGEEGGEEEKDARRRTAEEVGRGSIRTNAMGGVLVRIGRRSRGVWRAALSPSAAAQRGAAAQRSSAQGRG